MEADGDMPSSPPLLPPSPPEPPSPPPYPLSDRFRFVFTAVRCSDRELQLQEVHLYSNGVQLTMSNAANPGGDSPHAQPPADVIDRDVGRCEPTCANFKQGSKWLDFNKGDLVMAFSSPVAVASYDWMTANDHPARDPTKWTLQGSNVESQGRRNHEIYGSGVFGYHL